MSAAATATLVASQSWGGILSGGIGFALLIVNPKECRQRRATDHPPPADSFRREVPMFKHVERLALGAADRFRYGSAAP